MRGAYSRRRMMKTIKYEEPRELFADLYAEMIEAEEERIKERDAAKKAKADEAQKHKEKADQKEKKAKNESKE
jgi:hypothetical protein